MNALAFLNTAPVAALLKRAAASAGVPLSVHFVKRNQEGTRICGWGQCAACRAVHELPGGGTACRLSRTAAATVAMQQQRPIPFVCHLGFGCVSAPLLPGEGYLLTLGPFCPMEEQQSLEDDIRSGFSALLEREIEELPVRLDDIHRAPAASVPAVAAWVVESIRAEWARYQEEAAASEAAGERPEATPLPAPARGAGTGATPRGAHAGTATEIAAALAAGSRKQVRALFLRALEELQHTGASGIDVRRAHVAALASAALEAVARTGVSADGAWQDYPAFIEAISAAESDGDLADAAVRGLAFLGRGPARAQAASKLPHYPALFALVRDRLVEGITLEEVAAHLGETPSAITHRLQRKFGLSFSGYMARLRVDRAKDLLRRTKLGTLEVARRVGIHDSSNFARLFKQVEGITPAAYRKRYGKKE